MDTRGPFHPENLDYLVGIDEASVANALAVRLSCGNRCTQAGAGCTLFFPSQVWASNYWAGVLCVLFA